MVDRQNTHVGDEQVCAHRRIAAIAAGFVARQQHVDKVARQHKACDADNVVDADRDGAMAFGDRGREGGAAAFAGNARREDGFVGFDRAERDARLAIGQRGDFGESALRQRVGRPSLQPQHVGGEGLAEFDGASGDDNVSGSGRALSALHREQAPDRCAAQQNSHREYD